MSIVDEIRMMAEELPLDAQSEPSFCPFCKARHEHKFSMRRIKEGVLYNCFRGKCGARGFLPMGGGYSFGTHKERPEAKAHKSYDATGLRTLYMEDEEFFERTWGIREHRLLNRVFVTPDDEYAFRITDEMGHTLGWHIRQPRWKGVTCHRYGVPGAPKGMTYKNNPDGSKLSWFVGHHVRKSLVLVEDYISALKLSQFGYAVVCLFGTKIGDKDAQRIRRSPLDFDEVLVWLDADAVNESYEMVKRYGVSLNMRVIQTPSDPKDLSREVIQELI